MNVSQLMNRNVQVCSTGSTLAEAAGKMWDHDIGCLPVVDRGQHVVGMITDRDVCMAAYTQGRPLTEILVGQVMSQVVYSCLAEDSIIEAEQVMKDHKVRRMPVTDRDGVIQGILSLNDIAREAIRQQGRRGREISGEEVTATLAAVCEPRGTQSLRPSPLS